MKDYLFIGDVHGYAFQLESLLKKAGFTLRNGAYRHSELQAAFVGDLINRGPDSLQCIELVRAMCEAGSAIAVPGNHELILVQYHQIDPATGKPVNQHRAGWNKLLAGTHASFEKKKGALESALAWVKQLPILIETRDFALVHACWDTETVSTLHELTRGSYRLEETQWQTFSMGHNVLSETLRRLCSGISIYLDTEELIPGLKEPEQFSPRIRYWEDPTEKNLDQTLFLEREHGLQHLRFLSLPPKYHSAFKPYPEYEKLVVHGHYCLQGELTDPPENVMIVDRAVIYTQVLQAWNPDLGWITST